MTRRKTPEEYIQECKDKGYDLPIDNYISNCTKINHKCKQGHIYPQMPKDHLQGHGCSICSGTKKKTTKEYIKECKEKGLDLPIEDYKNAYTKINHKCKQGHIYTQTPDSHLHKLAGCPICGGTKKKTPEEYYNECKSKGYDLPIENYIDATTKIIHKCKQGHTYPQLPSSHLQGIGCPICNESHGENYIRNYLDKNNIKYEPQKRFHNLKDKTYLSYDFYLSDYNIIIEYQGIQHFESVSFNSKDYSDLDKQKYHDDIKRNYAKDNGYKLLELKYTLDTQDKVDTYLERRIK